jgi:hypothetical protein
MQAGECHETEVPSGCRRDHLDPGQSYIRQCRQLGRRNIIRRRNRGVTELHAVLAGKCRRQEPHSRHNQEQWTDPAQVRGPKNEPIQPRRLIEDVSRGRPAVRSITQDRRPRHCCPPASGVRLPVGAADSPPTMAGQSISTPTAPRWLLAPTDRCGSEIAIQVCVSTSGPAAPDHFHRSAGRDGVPPNFCFRGPPDQ